MLTIFLRILLNGSTIIAVFTLHSCRASVLKPTARVPRKWLRTFWTAVIGPNSADEAYLIQYLEYLYRNICFSRSTFRPSPFYLRWTITITDSDPHARLVYSETLYMPKWTKLNAMALSTGPSAASHCQLRPPVRELLIPCSLLTLLLFRPQPMLIRPFSSPVGVTRGLSDCFFLESYKWKRCSFQSGKNKHVLT